MLIINNRFLSLYDYNFLLVIEMILEDRKKYLKIISKCLFYLFLVSFPLLRLVMERACLTELFSFMPVLPTAIFFHNPKL